MAVEHGNRNTRQQLAGKVSVRAALSRAGPEGPIEGFLPVIRFISFSNLAQPAVGVPPGRD
jgi:hypothetical protein